MPKNEVATTEAPALPALYDRGSGISAADIEVQRIYVQADLSQLVKARITEPGDVVMALGADDVDPTWLIGGPDKRTSFDAFILARRRFVARTESGGDIEWLPDDYQRAPGEQDVWEGFNYLVAVPEVNDLLPARMMLWKTAGAPVAKRVNTYILQAEMRGTTDPLCVTFTVAEKIGQRSKQRYYALVPKLNPNPDPEQLECAKRMLALGLSLGGSSEPAAPAALPEGVDI